MDEKKFDSIQMLFQTRDKCFDLKIMKKQVPLHVGNIVCHGALLGIFLKYNLAKSQGFRQIDPGTSLLKNKENKKISLQVILFILVTIIIVDIKTYIILLQNAKTREGIILLQEDEQRVKEKVTRTGGIWSSSPSRYCHLV